MAVKVLDSFALLAFLRGETGGDHIRELLEDAIRKNKSLLMTEVNYAEVKYIILRKDGEKAWREVIDVISTLPLAFHDATRQLADLAADFKSRHRMSLADAFAAALTKEKKAELVTGDPEFKALEGEIKVNWLAK